MAVGAAGSARPAAAAGVVSIKLAVPIFSRLPAPAPAARIVTSPVACTTPPSETSVPPASGPSPPIVTAPAVSVTSLWSPDQVRPPPASTAAPPCTAPVSCSAPSAASEMWLPGWLTASRDPATMSSDWLCGTSMNWEA